MLMNANGSLHQSQEKCIILPALISTLLPGLPLLHESHCFKSHHEAKRDPTETVIYCVDIRTHFGVESPFTY